MGAEMFSAVPSDEVQVEFTGSAETDERRMGGTCETSRTGARRASG